MAAAGVNFEVWFLTPHALQPSKDREFDQVFAWDENLTDGYPHRFVPIAPGWRMNEFRGVQVTEPWGKQLRERGITDLWVEGWRFAAYWSVIKTARRAGIRVWMRGENTDLGPESMMQRTIKRPVLSWLFRRVDHFLAIGSSNRRFYQRHGVPESRIHSAPYAVDNDAWRIRTDALRTQREVIRQQWGIPSGAHCVLFCGKLIEKKRPQDLVTAAEELVREGTSLFLVFAGDGSLRPLIESALWSPGAPPGCITGFLNLSQIPTAFAAADSLVLPSNFGETWGLVVNEALASGLPVAASDRCGCAEDLVRPLHPDLVFPWSNPAGLAKSLRRLVTSPPTHEVRQAVIDRHDFRVTIATTATLLALQAPAPSHA